MAIKLKLGRVFAFAGLSTIAVLGTFGWAMTQNSNGVYVQEKVGDLDFELRNVYQFAQDTKDLDSFNSLKLEIENTNKDKDASLKILYEYDDKNETVFVDIPAKDTETIKLDVFDSGDVNGLGIYPKTITIKKGDEVVKTFDSVFNVGTVDLSKNNDMRVPNMIVGEDKADNFVLWVDVNDSKDLDEVKITENTNTSKITVTNVAFSTETLNSNEWAKVTVNYEAKGSVLDDELYKDGIDLAMSLNYDDDSNVSKTIKVDYAHTDALSKFVEKQEKNFADLSLIN